MKLTFTANAENQTLVRTDSQQPVSDSVNYLDCEFTLTAVTGMTCTPTFSGNHATLTPSFSQNETEENTVVTCRVPEECISHPGFSVCISAYSSADNRRITFQPVNVAVLKSGYSQGESPSSPEPTVYEQILAMNAEALEAVENMQAEVILLDAHSSDNIRHITAIERAKWNNADNQTSINSATLGTQRYNLLENGASDRTIGDATCTVNGDGSITINGSYTSESGSAGMIWTNLRTGATTTNEQYDNHTMLPPGEYIVSGATSKINLQLVTAKTANTYDGNMYSTYSSTKFAVAEDEIYQWLRVRIVSGSTFDNETFYPMIRPADVATEEFSPYQPSLLERINALESRISALEGGT